MAPKRKSKLTKATSVNTRGSTSRATSTTKSSGVKKASGKPGSKKAVGSRKRPTRGKKTGAAASAATADAEEDDQQDTGAVNAAVAPEVAGEGGPVVGDAGDRKRLAKGKKVTFAATGGPEGDGEAADSNTPDEAEDRADADEEVAPPQAENTTNASLLVPITVRVEAASTRAVTFRNANAELTVTVQVHPDPEGHNPFFDPEDQDNGKETPQKAAYDWRLGYRGILSLQRENTTAAEEIGHIEAWRIDKPTGEFPRAAAQSQWIRDALKSDLDACPGVLAETAGCLRALYTQAGTVKAGVRNKGGDAAAEALAGRLLFIEMIYLRPQFQRRGLLGPALEGFYAALGALPEWYVFGGAVVLVPARPSRIRGDAWGETDEGVVEQRLQAVYERQGYALWNSQKVGAHKITVLGRTLSAAGQTEGDSGGARK